MISNQDRDVDVIVSSILLLRVSHLARAPWLLFIYFINGP
jgi:hypothetical protein